MKTVRSKLFYDHMGLWPKCPLGSSLFKQFIQPFASFGLKFSSDLLKAQIFQMRYQKVQQGSEFTAEQKR